jgi:hypothetical protein
MSARGGSVNANSAKKGRTASNQEAPCSTSTSPLHRRAAAPCPKNRNRGRFTAEHAENAEIRARKLKQSRRHEKEEITKKSKIFTSCFLPFRAFVLVFPLSSCPLASEVLWLCPLCSVSCLLNSVFFFFQYSITPLLHSSLILRILLKKIIVRPHGHESALIEEENEV